MPKVKLPRKGSHVDMTAMCDVAFLLLTFFMLATKFKPQEPVVIRTPKSTSTVPIPQDYMLITLSKEGRVFYTVDNLKSKDSLIRYVNESKGLKLSEENIKTFVNGGAIGVPFNMLKSYLNLGTSDRNEYDKTAPGIPVDTTMSFDTNELAYWVKASRFFMKSGRIAIKADGEAKYPSIQKVIKTLGNQKVFRFNFITDGKAVPQGSALEKELLNPTPKPAEPAAAAK